MESALAGVPLDVRIAQSTPTMVPLWGSVRVTELLDVMLEAASWYVRMIPSGLSIGNCERLGHRAAGEVGVDARSAPVCSREAICHFAACWKVTNTAP